MRANKITWAKIGHVDVPGRYIYSFGFLTITAEDIDVWRQYPHASFTLISQVPSELSVGEEYRLGAFDIGKPES